MKVAIVIPWFGRELKGGAEQQAWQIAARLAGRGHKLDVLTTCCRSHQDDWATNHLPAGVVEEPERFTVRRYLVENRNRPGFDAACGKLLAFDRAALRPGVPPVQEDESRTFFGELIKSTALTSYVERHVNDYDWFLLLPYLYGPVLEAARIVGPRAALQPCLHNESYAYLPEVAEAFRSSGRLLFNSEGEQELALRLFGPGIVDRSRVVGEGVEIESPVDAGKSSGPNGQRSSIGVVPQKFVLYVGRKDPEKNVPLLVDAFRRFRRVRPNSELKLLLAGLGELNGTAFDGVTDLGLVSEEKKQQLMRDCVALVQPSLNESFSRVLMEAWRCGRPVAAHSQCLATAVAVERSGGGWTAGGVEEWASLFTQLDRAEEADLQITGRRGFEYALVHSDWEKVIDRYETALAPEPTNRTRTRLDRTIHQVLPNLSYGDAISNEALFIRDSLRAAGCTSEIYVRYIDPRVANECHPFFGSTIQDSDGIIYHHSIGTELTPHVVTHPGPKFLIYHNITPAEFVEPYRPAFAEILRSGRRELPDLARHFPHSAGDSSYNADELRRCGFSKPGVLPISVDPAKWNIAADTDLMRSLQDGRTNILFVGRIAPNKKQDELVRAFAAYKTLDPTARLILVGTPEAEDPYAVHLQAVIKSLGLQSSVTLTGNVTDPQLAAYYRTAHLFWSRSEHEGFCVPLVEAMWFDVPVLALKSTAVPETLGRAAVMFTEKAAPAEVAALASFLVRDIELRRTVIAAQRNRRLAFTPAAILPLVAHIAANMALQTAGSKESDRVSRRHGLAPVKR